MIDINDIQTHIGDYIRLGGFGIIDGMGVYKSKADFYKIIRADDERVVMRRYRARNNIYLPQYRYNQRYEIITPKTFKSLPTY